MNVRLLLPLLAALGACGAVRAEVDPLPDPRLSAKVTLTAYNVPLERLARDLARQTGVAIRVGSGERDWRVRERKVHVVFRNRPLGDELTALKDLLGYTVQRTGEEGRWAYRIWQTPRQRDYEAAMVAEARREQEKEITDLREAVFDDAEAAAALTPDEAKALRETDPWKAYLGGTDAGRAYGELLKGMPDDAKALVKRGQKVILNVAELSPGLKDAVNRMVQGGFYARGGADPQSPEIKDLTLKTPPTRVAFMPTTPDMLEGMPSDFGLTGIAYVLGDLKAPTPSWERTSEIINNDVGVQGMPLANVPLAGSQTRGARWIANAFLKLEDGVPASELDRTADQDLKSLPTSDFRLSRVVPTPKPTDPALLTEIEPLQLSHRGPGQKLKGLIEELSTRTPLSFAVETFPDEPDPTFFLPAVKTPLYQLLDTLQTQGYIWTFEKGIVGMRPRDWALRRLSDVPESLLAGYRAILNAKGWLEFNDMAAMAVALTDEQITGRVVNHPDLSFAVEPLSRNNMGWIRFYGGLSEAQRARALSPVGLSLAVLTIAQWEALAQLVTQANSGAELNAGVLKLAFVEEIPTPPAPTTPTPADETNPEWPVKPINPSTLKVRFSVEMPSDTPGRPKVVRRELSLPPQAMVKWRLEMKRWEEDAEKHEQNPRPENPTPLAKAEPAAPPKREEKARKP